MKKLGLLGVGLLGLTFVLVACGGGGEQSTVTREPTSASPAAPTATSPPQPTATPTSPPMATSGPTATPPSNGDEDPVVAMGRELYLNVPANAAPQALWCYQCHLIQGIPEANGLIGPEHTRIGSDAAVRVPGMSAEDYLRESIVDPELRVAEGVERATPGLMTKAIVEKLTDEQVEALVAFMLTLK